MLTREEVADYMKTRTNLSDGERERCFRNLAEGLGTADAATQEFRQQCKDTGFRVVFRSGLSRKQTLEVLHSKSTQKILASRV